MRPSSSSSATDGSRAPEAGAPGGGGAGAGASRVDPVRVIPKENVPLGKQLLRAFLILFAGLLLLIFAYRWIGTSTMRGSVQRVYEKEARYRIEFVDTSGEVHVVENEVIKFPHFKTDTADLQAELHRFSQTGDIIDLTTWGFRSSFISMFPNAVGVDFVRSNAVRKKHHVDRITESVVNELIDQGVVRRGQESERMRPGLSKAIEKTAASPSPFGEQSPTGAEPAP